MAKVLITGANGFIGSRLAATLVQRGDQVTCLVRKTSQLERLQTASVTLAYGDVTDPDSLRAPVAGQDFVFQVAGCTRALDSQVMYRVNETGVRNVLSVCAEQPRPPVVVTVSSLAAAGPAPRGRLRMPDDPLCPVSHYGFSKRAGEKAAEEFADRIPITVVRPAIVFGEGDPVSLELFRIPARFRSHLVPGFLPSRFSLIHVDDLVELMIVAAERGRRLAPPGKNDKAAGAEGYYFAVCPEHPTYHQLGVLVARALGRRIAVLSFPSAMVWLVATANEVLGRFRGQPLYLDLDKAREATAGSWACTHQPVADDLGLTFPVPLVDRMRQTIQWHRAHGWL